MAQTAEGAMSQVGDALQRMRELAVQARNSTNSSSDRDSLDKEFGELASEIQRVIGGTTFNNLHIIGSDAGSLTFQVGANVTTDDTIDLITTNMGAASQVTNVAGTSNTGAGRAVIDSSATSGAISSVITNIDSAIDFVNSQRATMGAAQNRFSSVISNLQVSVENQTASRSRIMDADFAAETANLSRAQILQQAGSAMIAQANQLPQQVLALLQ